MSVKHRIHYLFSLVSVAAIIFSTFQLTTVHAQGQAGSCDQFSKNPSQPTALTSTANATLLPHCIDNTSNESTEATGHILHPYQWYAQRRDQLQLSGATNNLEYQANGPIMQTIAAYVIYWIPPGSSMPSAFQTTINQYFADVGKTALFNVLTQYYQDPGQIHIKNVSTFGGSYTYTSGFPHAGSPSAPLTDGDIRSAVQAAITANSWPTGLNTMYFVFTPQGIESCMSNGVSCTIGVTASPVDPSQGYCAYHNSFDLNGQKVIYANMPYVATWDTGYFYNGKSNNCHGAGFVNTPNDHDADEEISVVSHEQFEAVTDPLVNVQTAWTELHNDGTEFGEIGDKCAYIFGAVDPIDGHNTVLNGHAYEVQQEWSNAAFNGAAYSGCVLRHQADVDVAVAKTGPVSAIAGNTLAYTISVMNTNATFEATDVALTDAVPAGTIFESFTQISGPSFSCAVPVSGGTGSIICTRLALPASATATFTLLVHISPSTPNGTNLANTATITTTSNDPGASNDAATVNTIVSTAADLAIEKSSTANLLIPGIEETYTLTVTNNGPSDAQNVALTDVVPTNTTFITATQTGGPAFTCLTPTLGGTGAIGCSIATLPFGASATFTATVRVSPVDTNAITNTATISAATTDPDLGNNTSTISATVSIRAYKQGVLANLNALFAATADKHDAHLLHEASEALTDSVKLNGWINGNTLVAEDNEGKEVFTDEQKAVDILSSLSKHNISGISAALQVMINQLVAADRALADIAINQAIGQNGRPNQIAQAQKQLAQGDTSAQASKYTTAIKRYLNAWQHAQQAMNNQQH